VDLLGFVSWLGVVDLLCLIDYLELVDFLHRDQRNAFRCLWCLQTVARLKNLV